MVALPFLVAAQPRSSMRLDWATTGSHCVIGGVPSLEYQKKAFNHSAWRGEKVFAQAVISSDAELKDVTVAVSDLRSGKSVIGSGNISVQFVSFVVSDLLDTTKFGQCSSREDKSKWGDVLVADVLDLKESMNIPTGRKQPVWMTVNVPSDAKPGKYTGRMTVSSSNAKARSLPVELVVSDHILPPAHDWTFHLDLWQNPYSVARYENVPLWSDAHFEAMRPVMKMLADAGQKSVTTTIMNRPWNGQTYYDQATSSNTTIQATPGSQEYNEYWGSFIADFARHLKSKGWFEKTMIAMDERPMESMQAVLSLIRNIEPGFKISLAGNYHEPINHEIADFSEGFAPKKEFPESAKAKRKELGLTTTIYTCCAEAHPNMFVISDPDEAAWLGWFAQAENYDGYLRWAYNSWTLDPLTDARFRTWPAGDCFVVYPGGRGSVRFSKLVEGIQDFEKVRILRSQWQKEGNEAKLAQLTEVLKPFTSDKILEEGPAKALITAKSFLDKQ